MKFIIIFLTVIIFASICFGFSKKPATATPVDFETILTGQHSSIDTAAVFLIDNEKDWADIWKLAQGQIEPMPPVVKIDFKTNMVLGIFMGQKTSGGYRTEVAEIIRSGDDLLIKVINYAGGGGSMLPVLTSPYQLVKIPAGDFKIEVEYKQIKE